MCQVLHVSRSGYYAHVTRPESKRSKANRELLDTIKEIYTNSRRVYGSPQITKNLPPEQKASRGRVDGLPHGQPFTTGRLVQKRVENMENKR